MLFILVIFTHIAYSADVYLVLGSDTAIWDGMETRKYHCTYNGQLYTDPSLNGYGVMDPAFRNGLVDSYSTPLKMTWWMMAGNIFRYATNNNVPIPNIMTMYLMKKYHGEMIERWGDELSLHYHTFIWSDYDGDGTYWWNQSETFLDCKDDFDYTLSQFLLEENVFPVSFRSGWHYMDNDWQHNLNELLPYSMHNASPYHGIDTEEPLDNNYDWSQGPRVFVPYHASLENYQIPGGGKGWNVRSIHFGTAVGQNVLDDIFRQASFGFTQVACIWGHLPETDFLTNIQKIDQLAHQAATKYPNVKFRYCTAIEAMQRYRKTSDDQPPAVSVDYGANGQYLDLSIEVDEPIFQTKPFVACKDVYENYFLAELTQTGENQWRISQDIDFQNLAKIGISLCDTVGNQTNKLIPIIPDDHFVDNTDNGYTELAGNWSTQTKNAWGVDSRMATVADSVIARWSFDVPETRLYNAFIQFPEVENPINQMLIELHCGRSVIDTVYLEGDIQAKEWIPCGSGELIQGCKAFIQLKSYDVGSNIAVDVVKFSAYVRDYDLYLNQDHIDFGEVVKEDTLVNELVLFNYGSKELTVYQVYSSGKNVHVPMNFPLTIPAMKSLPLPIHFCSNTIGIYQDTLFIESNDPNEPEIKLHVIANVQNYFRIVDNEDAVNYEESGDWRYSVTYAYGGTSRYSFVNQDPHAYAVYRAVLDQSGVYEIFEIVPKSTNSTHDAVYRINIGGEFADSIHINQNTGSGDWVSLGKYDVRAGENVAVTICNSGKRVVGDVLRSDAIKFSLVQEATRIARPDDKIKPDRFSIEQNYPNPFNPSTSICFNLPEDGTISIKIFNVRGEIVREMSDVFYPAGENMYIWDGLNAEGSETASGVYMFSIEYGSVLSSIKMLKLH